MLAKKISFMLMRRMTNKMLMDVITRAKANRIGKMKLPKGQSAFVADGNLDRHIMGLREDGFSKLDFKLSQEKIDEIVRFSEQIPCFDTYRSDSKPIDVRNPAPETHVANYRREDLIHFGPIMDIANDPGLLHVVQEFLGAKPTISNVNMWWSFGGRKQAEHAQLFHRDFDDWRFCKLFIYLTDVSATSGPHVYVRGTSASPKLRKIRRYSDQEIESVFGKENVLEFIDQRGTAFMVDTYGFHKGLLPKSEDRLLLQIQYSLHPIGIEAYNPVKMDAFPYEPYVNRLLVQP
jgi:hypothetical protein